MTLTMAVLGDSIAWGQGADRAQDTPGQRLATLLTESGTPTRVQMYAVPGARSEALAEQVRRAVAVSPDLALIVIGANDLTHLVPAPQAAAALDRAVRDLRAAGAQVVVAPAPDLSSVPWVPPQARALVRAGSMMLRQAQTRAALSAGARVADVDGMASARFAGDPSLFSADRFHPSSAGYELIAAALAPAVIAAAQACTAAGRPDRGSSG